MANSTKLLIFFVLIALISAIVFALSQKNSVSKTTQSNEITGNAINIENKKNTKSNASSSIADEWTWNQTADKQNDKNPDLFTSQSVRDALQAVEVDEFGDLVLNGKALFALDEALERIHKRLDPQALQNLIDLIQEALPGKLGEQTAELVKNYHGFLGAQAEFNQLHEYSNRGPQTLQTIEQDRALYSELRTLRELHLGTQTAQNLFAEVDAGAQFMFDMMSLDLNSSLTPEQIAQRRAEIQREFDQQRSPPTP